MIPAKNTVFEFKKVFTANSIQGNGKKLNNTVGSKQINPECEIPQNLLTSSISYRLTKQQKEKNNGSLKDIVRQKPNVTYVDSQFKKSDVKYIDIYLGNWRNFNKTQILDVVKRLLLCTFVKWWNNHITIM